MSKILDGKEVADFLLNGVKDQVSNLDSPPGLAVILVGDNPASKAYIGMKKKKCEDLGIKSFEFLLPETATEQELTDVIDTLNQRWGRHTIQPAIVQVKQEQWRMKQSFKSPHYTTSWDDLIDVN